MSATPIASPVARLHVDSIAGMPIELPIAGPGGRSFAFIIDWHIRVLMAVAWMFPMILLVNNMANEGKPVPVWLELLAWLPPLLIYLLYHPVLEVLMAGRTPGKRIAGVRIVTTGGAVPSAAALLVRNLFRFIDGLPAFYVVGLAFTVMTARNQRIGDLAAETLLVYDERRKTGTLDRLAGAGIAGGISTADTELVQDLLERWETLDSAHRVELARRLLDRLEPGEAAAHVAWLNDGNALAALQKWFARIR